jgi:NADH-quinone oxidoreductase subunit J
MTLLLFFVFASLAVLGGIGMVASRSPVSSLMSLVLSFFALAAIYILLGAHFIGAIQVLVYAGAIMVLFLFVIMLLNLGHDYRPDYRGAVWLVAGSVVAGIMGWALWTSLGGQAAAGGEQGTASIDAMVEQYNAVGAIAMPLFRDYLVPFELTSILLLVAIIGAVLLAKRRV